MFQYYFKLRWKVPLKGGLVLNKSTDGWKMACDCWFQLCVRAKKTSYTKCFFPLRIQKHSHSKELGTQKFILSVSVLFCSRMCAFFRQHSHHTQDVSAEVEHAIAVLVSPFFYHTHGAFWNRCSQNYDLVQYSNIAQIEYFLTNWNTSDAAHLLQCYSAARESIEHLIFHELF